MIYVLAVLNMVFMSLAVVFVFIAYREGIKAGMSIKNETKLPPIAPKAIKEEREEREREVEHIIDEVEKFEAERKKELQDISEAMDMGNLYAVQEKESKEGGN